MRAAWRDGDSTRVVEVGADGPARYVVRLDDRDLTVEIERLGADRLRVVIDGEATTVEVTACGERRFVRVGTLEFVLDREAPGRTRSGGSHGGGLEAPMPGVVTRVLVAAGDEVKKGQPLLALEAMKMEHLIRAPRDGRVRSVAATAGEMVNGGVALVEMEELE